jgi:hypothetical protein
MTTDIATRRFPVRFTGPNRALAAIGITRANSWVALSPTTVEVRMGWAFALRAERSSVRSAWPDHDRVLAWGVHGWRGRWLVNGSSDGLVRIELDPPARGRVLAFPLRVRTLRVSVEDPGGLVGALNGDDPDGGRAGPGPIDGG